jgi:hypothetical protein
MLRRMEGARGEMMAEMGMETADALRDMFRWAAAVAVAGREESKELVEPTPEREAAREALRAATSFSEAEALDSLIRLR